MSDTALLTEQRGAVMIITINDAPWNRMSAAFMDELEQLVTKVGQDEDVRAVVLTGAGDKNFSVGMNLKELGTAVAAKGGQDAFFDQRWNVISAIENMGKPWIATFFGNCLGGGLELPLGCHFRLAAEEGCQIGLPEMDLGAVPAWGGSARLPRVVGRTHAIDMILRGKKISGPEAFRIGLANEVWPLAELKDRAIALGEELAAQPRLAVQTMLNALMSMPTKTLDESLADERAAVHLTSGTPDAREGIMAFLEKRKPVFNQSSD